MEVLKDIIYMLGGLLVVILFVFSYDLPDSIVKYRIVIMGAYLLSLGAVTYIDRRNT